MGQPTPASDTATTARPSTSPVRAARSFFSDKPARGHIGGSLTLAQDARLAYRFAAGGNDTVTVDGLLTFPTNGVLHVSSLTAGLTPPAKDALFVSQQAISGPADLTGWTVEGVNKASLKYSADLKTIYFSCPNGTLIAIR